MHLQQTKVESRASGGPQYYFHSVSSHVKEFLRKRGACPVVLQTPYGIASSSFTAVGRDHKISEAGKIVAGKVGHDRIQNGKRRESANQCSQEKIKSAAVRLANGHVYIGLTHGDALENAHKIYRDKSESYYRKLFQKTEDGFVTSKRRFVDRDEAYEIAVKGRQIKPQSYVEAVHDLWGHRVIAGEELCALSFENARTDKLPQS